MLERLVYGILIIFLVNFNKGSSHDDTTRQPFIGVGSVVQTINGDHGKNIIDIRPLTAGRHTRYQDDAVFSGRHDTGYEDHFRQMKSSKRPSEESMRRLRVAITHQSESSKKKELKRLGKEGNAIAYELYADILVDRARMISSSGGGSSSGGLFSSASNHNDAKKYYIKAADAYKTCLDYYEPDQERYKKLQKELKACELNKSCSSKRCYVYSIAGTIAGLVVIVPILVTQWHKIH